MFDDDYDDWTEDEPLPGDDSEDWQDELDEALHDAG
jgi:hypothetical protein